MRNCGSNYSISQGCSVTRAQRVVKLMIWWPSLGAEWLEVGFLCRAFGFDRDFQVPGLMASTVSGLRALSPPLGFILGSPKQLGKVHYNSE